ncbi:MAG: hypothetical protein IJH39_04110 [Clostridia bacterium]|nr:hypothetical protein [Clostridia bacterium]
MELSNDVEDVIDTEIGIISILCDCSEDDILNLQIPEYQKLRNQAQWIMKKPDVKPYAPKSIKLNSEYDVYYDVSKLTTAQYIDFQSYLKQNDMDKYLTHILSVFIVPKGKEYGEVPMEEVLDDLESNISIKMALSMCFFFITEYLTLMKLTLNCLESRMKKTKNQELQKKLKEIHLLINGDGLITLK